MELACWAQFAVARGERKVEVEDYQVDMHTRRGVAQGRDIVHWSTQGAKLENKLTDTPSPWGKYLDDLYMGRKDKPTST